MIDWNSMKDRGQRMKVKTDQRFALSVARLMDLADITSEAFHNNLGPEVNA